MRFDTIELSLRSPPVLSIVKAGSPARVEGNRLTAHVQFEIGGRCDHTANARLRRALLLLRDRKE
jgi:hypothetical protein